MLADVDRDQLGRAAATLVARGGRVFAVTTDVNDPAAVEELAAAARDRFGAVDLVVNNAGITGPPRPVWQTAVEDWNQVIGVNLLDVVHGIRAFVPKMVEAGLGTWSTRPRWLGWLLPRWEVFTAPPSTWE